MVRPHGQIQTGSKAIRRPVFLLAGISPGTKWRRATSQPWSATSWLPQGSLASATWVSFRGLQDFPAADLGLLEACADFCTWLAYRSRRGRKKLTRLCTASPAARFLAAANLCNLAPARHIGSDATQEHKPQAESTLQSAAHAAAQFPGFMELVRQEL